ncbi:MAG: alcohol dehydrogenase catalytic domain-containing protein [Solirubrobacterales bacterium]|nr:alcohol dehydrogenase catalytic domain-containing protein [Solirubrobacterales bacterium]MBV9364242.1 alcohol dehydrogenase catalytic domain-containing protein [Solirubrobacterales bacterium]MBV9682847.1 alcohol dehydrogenase catalytic domain-containing protein [Solirubrobacterales bacterium]MBV9806311.1 alcohol dehydrogenase catalytic domain-containing protein [Solirubrobacterales bacterium]
MRVARSFAPGDVRIEEAQDPEPGPGEVVCEVLACGVCASDVTDWYVAPRLPAVLGHELVGTISALGPGATAPEPGTRVAIHHHVPCGECRRCRRGHETLCERFRATRLDPGGFAEKVRITQDLTAELLELPPGLDPATATFIEPLACVLRAQDRAAVQPGDALLVVGAGVNGLLQIAAAHARGVEAVWVREPRRERLELAEAWGAEHHGNEQVDVAIVCTPKPDAIASAAGAVAPGGSLCLYAPPAPGAPVPVDGSELFLRELTLTASYSAGPGDMRAALELIASRRIDPRELISHRLPLQETGRALELQRRAAGLKVVVEP